MMTELINIGEAQMLLGDQTGARPSDDIPDVTVVQCGQGTSKPNDDIAQKRSQCNYGGIKMRHLLGKPKGKLTKSMKKSRDKVKLAVRCENENDIRSDKTVVYVQVVFIKLGEIETVKEYFTADVFIQARWREPKLDGMHNAVKQNPEEINWKSYWNPKLYVDNTVGEPKETIGHTVVYDMNTWEAFIMERRRIKGAFLENLALFQFPFDTQVLKIKILSEKSDDELVLIDDPQQFSTINVESFIDEQEWRLYNEVETFTDVVSKFYQGDTAENSTHPSFTCRTHASRRPGFYIINILMVMCFICSMPFATFSVDHIKRENRLQMTFTLLLTTVTFKFAVNSSLPRISYLTHLDAYIMTSMFILILVCVWHASIITIKTSREWSDDVARYYDTVVLISLASVYVLFHVIYALTIGIQAARRRKIYEAKERRHKKKLKKDSSHLQDIRRASIVAARVSHQYK